MTLRPGIAITTYNRRDLLLQQIALIRKFSVAEIDLVVCDDGSTDGTIEAVTELGIPLVRGQNRGVAWNKNRGIFYLVHHSRADAILLMDDDVLPTMYGWETEWTRAAVSLGHVNYTHPDFKPHVFSGSSNAADPGISTLVGGMCMAMSREAVGSVGYMDVRFGRYGHEHTDYSNRYVRAGYGGLVRTWRGERRTLFYVIDSGVKIAPSESTGSPEEANKNVELLNQLADEPIYRAPWRSDEQRVDFIREFRTTIGAGPIGVEELLRDFDEDAYLAANPDLMRSRVDPLRHYLWVGHRENRRLRP